MVIAILMKHVMKESAKSSHVIILFVENMKIVNLVFVSENSTISAVEFNLKCSGIIALSPDHPNNNALPPLSYLLFPPPIVALVIITRDMILPPVVKHARELLSTTTIPKVVIPSLKILPPAPPAASAKVDHV